jgi:predicted transcriptional regulator
MPAITVSLSDECLQQLRERAARFRLAPEELMRVCIEDVLARPEDQLERAIDRVLTKNVELYRRLG